MTTSRRPPWACCEYNFGNFEVMLTSALTRVDGRPRSRGHQRADRQHQLSVATFNVENLDPADGPAKFADARTS